MFLDTVNITWKACWLTPPVNVTVLGDIEHVAPGGPPLQVSEIGPVKPPREVTVTVYVAGCPNPEETV